MNDLGNARLKKMFAERTQAVQDVLRADYEKEQRNKIVEIQEKDEDEMTEAEKTLRDV